MKKIILYFFISSLIISNIIVLPVKANDNAEENLTADEQSILKGSASYSNLLPNHTKLKVSVNQELDSLQNQIGDEFSATILNDLNVNDINLIPIGSIVIGHVMDIKNAGKASMQGSIEISFDKIVLPSGKYIPLTGARFAADRKYTNKNRDLKGEGNGLTRGVGLGVLKGATLTFLPGNKAVKTAAIGVAATGAVFSGGWSITSTAVIGGLTGLAYGLKKHGQEVMLTSGQELEIELDENQDLNPLEVAVDDLMNQAVQTTNSNETIIK